MQGGTWNIQSIVNYDYIFRSCDDVAEFRVIRVNQVRNFSGRRLLRLSLLITKLLSISQEQSSA
jgi:hypothetical protein